MFRMLQHEQHQEPVFNRPTPEQDFAAEDFDVYAELDAYYDLDANKKKELYATYEKALKNPQLFFSPDHLHSLKSLNASERVYLLSQAAKDLQTTPSKAAEFFNIFPNDKELVDAIFAHVGGMPRTGNEQMLFSLLIGPRRVEGPEADVEVQEDYYKTRYAIMAERRERAPRFLLSDKHDVPGLLKKYGKAAERFVDKLSEADDLYFNGSRRLDTANVFSKDFDALSPQEQAAFLRSALAVLQYTMVFNEAFNSEFSEERVEQDRKVAHEPQDFLLGKLFRHQHFNIAHSILFQTYQPRAVFDAPQSYYDRHMDSRANSGGDIEEYAHDRLLLAVLERLKNVEADSKENVEAVVDFWDKNRNPIFGNAVAAVLSKHNPEVAASLLMARLKKESRDKHVLAAILYRLEFGRIGISEQGVKYLERQYDLGEHNNPDLHVRRLTSEGDIGIFNEDLELIKHFNLGDLTDGRTHVQAKVLDFVYETLFVEKPNETAEERSVRVGYLEEFKKHYYAVMQDALLQKTGIRLNSLTFQEQGWFLLYYSKVDEQQKNKLQNFVEKFHELGLKTFFAMEQNTALGETILTLADSLPHAAVETIFIKFGEIVATTDQIERVLQTQFKVNNAERGVIKKEITQRLIARACKVLEDQSKNTHEGKSEYETVAAIKKDLDKVHADVLLFANTFKILSDKQGIKLEDFVGVTIEDKENTTLSASEKEQMIQIFTANREANPIAYPKPLLEKRKQEFAALLNETEKQFYILSLDNKVVAFIHFEEHSPGRLYAGSLNMDTEGRGNAVGSAFLHATLENVGNEYTIEAVVNGGNPMLKHYVKDFGFKIVRHETKLGQDYVWLERAPSILTQQNYQN